GTVCVVGKMRDLILQLSKSSIYSTKPQYALTMFRQSASPLPEEVDGDYEKYGVGPQYVFRCVVNK
ncbi:hypothetical protein V6154_22350, partial [Klebsiella pneumoniae]